MLLTVRERCTKGARGTIDKNFNDRSLLEADNYECLVYHNPSWIEVRELALKTLHIFGYKPYSFNYD